jgi:hypothetical protein
METVTFSRDEAATGLKWLRFALLTSPLIYGGISLFMGSAWKILIPMAVLGELVGFVFCRRLAQRMMVHGTVSDAGITGTACDGSTVQISWTQARIVESTEQRVVVQAERRKVILPGKQTPAGSAALAHSGRWSAPAISAS